MRFKVHVYSILLRKCWHYSNQSDNLNDLLWFFRVHKMDIFDDRLKHRLYRVHDNVDNKDTFFIVDYEKLSYKHNYFYVIDRDVAESYIKDYGGKI